jgi:mono/diheme cytochrome c family protein
LENPAMFSFLLRIASVLAFLGTAAVSLDVHAKDIERGRQLYENHCVQCHTVQVHGRKNRTALSVADLREIVDQWQANQKLRWRQDEIDDVVHYLSTTRYFFTTGR